jgi:hypothetical protein
MYWLRKTEVQSDGAVLEQVERDDGLRGSPFDQEEGDRHEDARRDHERRLRGDPVELLAGEGDPDQQGAHGASGQSGAEVVDADLALGQRCQVKSLLDDDEGDYGYGDADEEVPAPAEAVGDDSTQQRTADRSDGHDRPEQAHVLAALAWADDVGHHHLGQGHQAPSAEALDNTERDELAGSLGEPAQDRAEDEDDQGCLQEQFAVGQVGELAPQGSADGHGEHRGGDDPGEGTFAAAQVADDLRQRCRDDGAGQDRDEHAEHEPGKGLEDLAVSHGGARLQFARWSARQCCGFVRVGGSSGFQVVSNDAEWLTNINGVPVVGSCIYPAGL